MRRAEAGFSLVEVMTAMFIAALAAAAVVLALPKPEADEAQAAERLAASLTRAQRASVIEGAPVGLTLGAEGYSFAVWQGGRWRALDRASGLGPQDWPDGVLVDAQTDRVGGAPLPEGFPAIVFDATGGATPFVIELSGAGMRARVRGAASGDVSVERPDA